MNERVQGKVLVVDPDYNTLGMLSRALRARGHHVTLCADGRQGLQRAVEGAPDVVLVDREIGVVDVATFVDVLRDNPRTCGACAFVMSAGEPCAPSDPRTQLLVKPFHVAEVVARIEAVLRQRLAPRPDPELRGDLGQVALFDLLQVFDANRRTGLLRLEVDGASGTLHVREGRVVDCAFRGARGEKALYRVLACRAGSFVFSPGITGNEDTISAGTDMLLMEAVRQADEVSHVLALLPGRDAQVALSRKPKEPSLLADRIVQLLGEDTLRIDELLDRFEESDLEILTGLRELLEANALVVLESNRQRARLCEEDEEVVLRAAALGLRPRGVEGKARLAVLHGDKRQLTRLLRALDGVEGFVSEASHPVAAGAGALGPMGTLRVAGVEIELYAVPHEASLRPAWGPLLSTTRAALWLDSEIDAMAQQLLRGFGVSTTAAESGWEHPQGAAMSLRATLVSVSVANSSSSLSFGAS